MPLSHEQEITPKAEQIWSTFQKEMIPYLLSLLPDALFAPGREAELFLAMNKALYEKYVADGAQIPRDIQYRLQLDICSLMPVFERLKNMDELLTMVFDPELPGPSAASLSANVSGQVVPLDHAAAFMP